MNFTFTNFAYIDARAVLALVENNEWQRAYDRAQVLLSSIEGALREHGLEPSAHYIYDSTPVA